MSNNASPLVRALEDAWAELQRRFPEIPDVVVVLGSGTVGGTLDHWGTWTEDAWNVTGKPTGEFKLSGETAAQGAEAVLAVLIHEAAHALNGARNVKDVSRQGRYHNNAFLETAMELGLQAEKSETYGWTHTSYVPRPQDAVILKGIQDALKIDRTIPPATPEDEEKVPTSVKTECACPRKLRLRLATQEEGPVICGVCNEEFLEVA